MPIIIENIPDELRDLPQWLLWRRELRDDKPTKIPYQPCGTKNAKSNDPSTWCNFDEAIAAFATNKFDGIGFVFSASDPYVGIDLDHCVDPQTSLILPWTAEQRAASKHWANTCPDPASIIAAADTYSEFSPSGTGVHLIVKGTLAKGLKRGDFEAYKIGRYFSVTGNKLPTSPKSITEYSGGLDYLSLIFDSRLHVQKPARHRSKSNGKPTSQPPSVDRIIAKIRTASNAVAFDKLFAGDWSNYPSQSEGDAALCGIVAFWSAGDPASVDAVFRQSKLYRDKWDEQHSGDGRTYGEMTVDNSIDGCSEFYDWSGSGKPAPKTYSLGPATFTVKSTSPTGKKISVTIELSIDGKPIDVITFTTAASNRTAAAKAIKQRCFCGDDPTTIQQIDNVLGTILVDASRPQELTKADDRPPEAKDIHEILEEIIPPMVQLAYRTDGGKAYSRVLGDEMSRAEFSCRYLNKEVIIAVSKAFDAPRDENEMVVRSKLIPAVKQELEVLWGHLLSQLETFEGAELPDDDRSVSDFRQLIIDLWTRPCAMGIHSQHRDKGPSVQLASRLSMASKVSRMKQENTLDFCDKWTPIHETYKAYYREHGGKSTGGELVPYLAMKFELFSQMGIKPKGITKRTFKALSVKYLTSDPAPPFTHRMTNGGHLIVLSQQMTKRILSVPSEESKYYASEGELFDTASLVSPETTNTVTE